MFKNYHYINAGTVEIHRYGKKAQEKASAWLEPNSNGYISIPVNGLKYWSIGTNNGKYGEFAKIKDVCFSVNNGGFIWAKAGTEKGDLLTAFIKKLVEEMQELRKHQYDRGEEEEEEEE